MRKYVLVAAVHVLFTASFSAAGMPWRAGHLVRYCADLLQSALPRSHSESANAGFKIKVNRQALRDGRALLLSQEGGLIKAEGGRVPWIDEITRRTIDWVLDENLPGWRGDGAWYFQTLREIYLYSRGAESPIRFSGNTIILMKDHFAIAVVTLGANAGVLHID
ncbi:MAG: hypothetical protein ACXWQE_00460 [Bdellovibrionales bacterium]